MMHYDLAYRRAVIHNYVHSQLIFLLFHALTDYNLVRFSPQSACFDQQTLQYQTKLSFLSYKTKKPT